MIMKCVVCGKTIQVGKESYYNYDSKKGLCCCSDECFTIQYWKDTLKTGVVINGICYQIGNENERGFRGFDGRPYKIQLDNGDIYYTTNLWYNGKVPKEYYNGDNARFIK